MITRERLKEVLDYNPETAAEQCLGFQDCDTNSSAKKYITKQGGVC